MLNVFLDTQVYDANNFQFNNRQFMRLKKYIDDGLINLITTQITKGEVQAHISENVEKAKQQLNKVRILKNSALYDSLLKDDSFKLAKEEILTNFENFISDFKVVEIPIYEGATKVIFENYFDKKPPFSQKKKDEFPDAFFLYSLLNWAEENEQIVYVVSGDPDIKDFCENHQNLIYVISLGAMFDKINEQNKSSYIEARILLRDQKVKILEYLNEFISYKNIDLYLTAYDTESIEVLEWYVESIEFPSALLLDINKSGFTVSADALFNIGKLNITEIDDELSPWDAEKMEYLYKEYKEQERAGLKLLIRVDIKLAVDDYGKQKFSVEDIIINDNEEFQIPFPLGYYIK
ncbi:PIN domain-containing protein [Bacillus altitudinis]|uniref:PIN domain-containing protein n=1 Tax=Bacillus altitudinis TaxID=293387 RepID=UPI001BCA6A67|nr:PIN domain-containing protein [Bacillus altitudinis]MBS4747502.1 hypothetical protein [Bacillus altitudinis]